VKRPTKWLSAVDELMLLGALTRASSHPDGSNPFSCITVESVDAAPARK